LRVARRLGARDLLVHRLRRDAHSAPRGIGIAQRGIGLAQRSNVMAAQDALPLDDVRWRVLIALADTLIPEDDYPSASAAGFRRFVERNTADLREPLGQIVGGLDALASMGFGGLSESERHAVVERIDRDDAPWSVETSPRWLRRVLAIVAQSYYADPDNGGNSGAASWRMLGFDPSGQRALPPTAERVPSAIDSRAVRDEYDAIVVG